MIVYVMRHDEAQSMSPDGDSGRRLTDEGRRRAEATGRGFVAEGHRVSAIVSSPFARTMETVECFLRGSGFSITADADRRLASGARPEAMMEVIQESEGPLLLVGHMPDVAELTAWLISGGAETRVSFGTGTIACIRFLGSPRPGSGTLCWMRMASQWP
ncbi:MAG: histidine phosphatase family protein [Myxococcota bacterium]